MSIMKKIMNDTVGVIKLAVKYLDFLLTPGTYLAHVLVFPENYQPSHRGKMLLFSLEVATLILAVVGLAMEIGAILGFVGCNPIHWAAWIGISIMAATVSDPHFQMFHAQMPIGYVVNSFTFVALLAVSIVQTPGSISKIRNAVNGSMEMWPLINRLKWPVAAFVKTTGFGIKRAYSAVKSATAFRKRNAAGRTDESAASEQPQDPSEM